MFLRQSTASQTRVTPRFVDDTDFKTPETALTIANTDVKLSKNGAAEASKNSGGGTHLGSGRYALTFDATDSNTVGELAVGIVISGALPVELKYFVLEEAVYDALFAASAPGYVANAPVNVAQFGGTNLTAAAGIPEVKVASLASGAITATAIAADAIGASELAADAVAEIADQVWDEIASGHTTSGSYGDKFGKHLPAILFGLTTSGGSTTAVPMNTTTGLDGGVPSTVDDFYNGAVLIFTTGALAGQRTSVTDYVGSTKILTVTAITAAPATGVNFILV
jgi:hypothetical protein